MTMDEAAKIQVGAMSLYKCLTSYVIIEYDFNIIFSHIFYNR